MGISWWCRSAGYTTTVRIRIIPVARQVVRYFSAGIKAHTANQGNQKFRTCTERENRITIHRLVENGERFFRTHARIFMEIYGSIYLKESIASTESALLLFFSTEKDFGLMCLSFMPPILSSDDSELWLRCNCWYIRSNRSPQTSRLGPTMKSMKPASKNRPDVH